MLGLSFMIFLAFNTVKSFQLLRVEWLFLFIHTKTH